MGGCRQSREEKTEEVKAELQNSFIRHATDEMQNTRERLRGKTQKKKGNQVAPPVLLENKSFFNCASSELYQNLTLELYKSLDFAEKIYRTDTSEQNTSYREVLLGTLKKKKKKINSFKFISTFDPKT